MATKEVDFEFLLQKAGSLGLWQLKIFLFIALNGYFMAFQHLGSVFLAATPDHWCRLPGLSDELSQHNLTKEEIKFISIPKEERNGKLEYSQCSYYLRNYSTFNSSFFNFSYFNESANQGVQVESCTEWEYDKSEYSSTIVTEWNLVCSSNWLMSSVQGSYMAGVLVGCLIFGFISDRWGRRRAMLIAQIVFCTSSIATSFAVNYTAFIAGRFFTATSAPGVFASGFVIVTEVVDTKWRAVVGVCYQVSFGIGYACLPAIAYLIREWNMLQLAMSLPSLVLLASYWVIPESPRWLITKQKFNEALKVLHSCAKMNKCILPPDDELLLIMKELHSKEDQFRKKEVIVNRRILVTRLCSTKEMCKRTVTVYSTWFVVAMVYYGLALNSPRLGGNPFIVVFLGGILEIPAYFLGSFVVTFTGRRFTYSATFLLAGIMCFSILITPSDMVVVISTLAVLGKFVITITFAISYLFTAELFPTVIRNIAVSYGSVMGRVGSISAPYIVYLLGYHHQFVPLLVFGIASTCAGLVALLLPETRKSHLQETVTDVTEEKLKEKEKEKHKEEF